MSSSFTERRALSLAILLVAVGVGACTEVQVEETSVSLDTTACSSSSSSGNNNNGNGGSGQGNGGGNNNQPQPQISSEVMDTYIVQIFELNNPETATISDCDSCIASRSNCFFEKETCVCGDPTSVSADKLPGMLQDVSLSIPANYGSLYCMRIMAVQRSSQSEQCECDPSWETPDKVRLCAVSTPYAASPLKVQMPVQCTGRSFDACAADTSSAAPVSTN